MFVIASYSFSSFATSKNGLRNVPYVEVLLVGALHAHHDYFYEWLKAKQSAYNAKATQSRDMVSALVHEGWHARLNYVFWGETYSDGLSKVIYFIYVILFAVAYSKNSNALF